MARILVAEDYPPLAKVIAIACQRDGHEVERTGSKARALALAGTFDLAIVDLDLADGAGTDLVRRLGREGRVGRAVFLASATDHELLSSAEAMGHVVQKEFGVEELMAHVRQVLELPTQHAPGSVLAQAVGDQTRARAPVGRSGTHKRVR